MKKAKEIMHRCKHFGISDLDGINLPNGAIKGYAFNGEDEGLDANLFIFPPSHPHYKFLFKWNGVSDIPTFEKYFRRLAWELKPNPWNNQDILATFYRGSRNPTTMQYMLHPRTDWQKKIKEAYDAFLKKHSSYIDAMSFERLGYNNWYPPRYMLAYQLWYQTIGNKKQIIADGEILFYGKHRIPNTVLQFMKFMNKTSHEKMSKKELFALRETIDLMLQDFE